MMADGVIPGSASESPRDQAPDRRRLPRHPHPPLSARGLTGYTTTGGMTHGSLEEVAAVAELPLVVLFGQNSTGQARKGDGVGEDPTTSTQAFDLPVQPFQRVGRPDLLPRRDGEVRERGDVLLPEVRLQGSRCGQAFLLQLPTVAVLDHPLYAIHDPGRTTPRKTPSCSSSSPDGSGGIPSCSSEPDTGRPHHASRPRCPRTARVRS